MRNMNALSYTGAELATLYNKYKMKMYSSHDIIYPNRIGEQNATEALTTAVMLNKNRFPGGTLLAPPLNLYKPSEFTVAPVEKESILRRGEAKDFLLKSSDQILDDIELYGLIVTNDLYKISRNQEIISKADFSSDFIDFRRHLYKNIEKTGDLIINIIKKMKNEFNAMKKGISDNMRTKLRRNKGPSTQIEENFNKLKDKINYGAFRTEEYINETAEKIHSMIGYLAPPEIEINIEEPEPRVFDWDARFDKRKQCRVLRRYNMYLENRAKESMLIKERIKEDLRKKEKENALERKLRKKEREEERKRRKEEERRLRMELERKEREEMELFIKIVNESVIPNEGMIQLEANPYAQAERLRKRERQKTFIKEMDKDSKSVRFNESEMKSVNEKKTNQKKSNFKKSKTIK